MRILLLILLVGCFGKDVKSQVDTIKWTELSPLPDNVQRIGCGYFLIDSDFYVAGGQLGETGEGVSSVWQYHIPTDTWSQKNNLPFGGTSASASFVFNKKGYFLTNRDTVNGYECDTAFWQYDASGDSWTRLNGLPDNPRQSSAYFSQGDIGYVGLTYGCIAVDKDFWQYDPLSSQWSQISTFPGSATAASTATVAPLGSAYVFGGYDANGVLLNDVWKYTVSSDHWDSVGQMPSNVAGRAYMVFWSFDSIILGGGGGVMDTNFFTYLSEDFYKYDILQNTWTPVVFQNSFDSTEVGFTFVYNKRGYYFGGASTMNPNFIFSNKMWSFDASKYIDDSATGVVNIKSDILFSIYPNPENSDKGFTISTSESGEVFFYDALGYEIGDHTLISGKNAIKLGLDNEVVFYKAVFKDGEVKNGKIVLMR